MKKTYRLINACSLCCAICAATASLTSCQFEDEDNFPESASLRVEHTNEKVQQLLVKPENGWVIQYFCGTGAAHFEGFNLLARFDASGRVTLASNHRYLRNNQAGKYTEAQSIYQLLLEDGPVLAFNTWNDVLTPFVDPVSPWQAPKALIKDGAGMMGDNNFVITSYGDDEIMLRGERYSGRTRLIPCDRPWEEYLKDCAKMKDYITGGPAKSFYIYSATDTLFLTGLSTGRIRWSERIDDPLKNDSLSAVYTPTGFRLEHVDTLGSDSISKRTFQEFTLSADSTRLVSGDVSVIPTWDRYLATLLTTENMVLPFDVTLFSDRQKELYSQLDKAITEVNANYSLAEIGLGYPVGSVKFKAIVVSIYTTKAKKTKQSAALQMDFERTGYGKFKIISMSDGATNKNMDNLNKKSNDVESITRQFAETLTGEYEVMPDSYFATEAYSFKPDKTGTAFRLTR